MTDLSGKGVRVLLIATATHREPALPSVPSVARSFEGLHSTLVERCGVRPENLRGLLDPSDAESMARAVAEEAQRADSVLFVYFIGHGLLGPDNELHLAASGTGRLTPGLAEHQALSFSSLRQAVGASRAPSVVVVLDCCFSGRASLGDGTGPSFAMTPGYGQYFLASAEQLALAPPDAEYTTFTGVLIDVLRQGDRRESRALTLDVVYDAVFRKLSAQQGPLPRRLAGDNSGHLVIAPNPAAPAPEPSPGDREPAPGRCPYPSLDAFGVDDADVFCGRETMTEHLLAAASAAPADPLILVGPSGSGKTSLLNAGLLAKLRSDGLDGAGDSSGWPCVRLTPGPRPLQRLATALGDPAAETADAMRTDPGRAVELVDGLLADRLLVDRSERRLVVIVDQLEELFTVGPALSERRAFLRAVTEIARPTNGERSRALVIYALRADFYGQAAAYPDLRTALSDGQVLVEPMTSDELRAAIEKPAAKVGLELEDGLADLILHELGATRDGSPAAGTLPLLSHVLWETWRQRVGSRLTVSGYRTTGGIETAIENTADREYEALDNAGKHAIRRMLPRLVRVSEDAADTLQAVERSVLLHGQPDTDAAQKALDRFAGARLLTLDRDTVRISHEALLRAWDRLREWIAADREWLRSRQQLADHAAEWQQNERDPSRLYRGKRLAEVQSRAGRASTGTADLEPGIAEFLDASRRLERRGVRRVRMAVGGLILLVVLAVVGLGGAIAFQQRAEQAQQRDLARYLASEAEGQRKLHPGLAKQLSLLSYQLDRDAGRGALLNSQRTPGMINDGEPAYDLAYSMKDSRILAISTGDAIVLRAGGKAGRITGVFTGPIAVDNDGDMLVTATDDQSPRTATKLSRWDVSDPERPKRLPALETEQDITALTFSTDGGTLFAGTSKGDILRWNTKDPAARSMSRLRAHSAPVDSLAVSSRRGLLASASVDGRIHLWRVADGVRSEPLATLRGASYERSSDLARSAHRVAFDSSGTLLAAPADAKNEVTDLALSDDLTLWKLDDPRAPRQVDATKRDKSRASSLRCSDSITSLAFNPEGKQVVGSCGNTWQVWIYKYGTEALFSGASMAEPGHESGVVLFDPRNTSRLLQATDRGVKVWDIANGAQPGAMGFVPSPPGTGGNLAFAKTKDRQLLAVQGVGVNRLWDLDLRASVAANVFSSRAPDMFTGQDIALSPDGRLLADAEVYKEGKTEYVDLFLRNTARPKKALAHLSLDNGVGPMAFSATKPILAVSDFNGYIARNRKPEVVRLYDIADPRHPRLLTKIETLASSLTFSPDGRTLVMTDHTQRGRKKDRPISGRRVRSLDVTDPAHPTELWRVRLPTGVEFGHHAFRPDGRLFALYQGDGTLRVWHARRNRLVGNSVDVAVGRYGSDLAFSPDGTRLALIATDPEEFEPRPEVWDLSDPKAPVRQLYLPASSGGFYSLAFTPDGKALAVLRAFSGVDLWDLKPAHIVKDICNAAGDSITERQWKHYLPDRPYQPPCR